MFYIFVAVAQCGWWLCTRLTAALMLCEFEFFILSFKNQFLCPHLLTSLLIYYIYLTLGGR